ncbi:nicastrin isoform X1 [Hydra vulgaris]|uniref:nicastrin isoform X1 n=1 Tax=Hydra vulgaris TaxID=6087 RepID=UPI001F5E5B92|nr:nicastrin [Hydra vulgaris]
MAASSMVLVLLICLNNYVSSSKIEFKIYKSIKSYSPCILLTNATHQVGCTSNMGGNRGILHVVESDDDVDWLIDKGTNQPYIPLLNSSFFNENVMNKLMNSKKISGVLVVHKSTTVLPTSFSPDSKCPLDQFGAYSNDKENGNCQKIKWNPTGNDMSKKYYGIPIFALADGEEINELVKCYQKHNKLKEAEATPSFPLCAIEMKDFMFASKDTPTCRRKTEMPNPIQSTYCDPLGDNNIYGSLFPMVDKIENDEVIMAATRLDSTAFFHDFAPAADNGVTGIVTLLAAAHALGDYKRYIISENITEKLKPIVFTFFNGEVWDYIGSSKMVYDMERDSFPYSLKKSNTIKNSSKPDDGAWTSKFNLKNIAYFMEITQVGLSDKIYAHTDPVSLKDNVTMNKVEEMLKYTKESFENAFMPFDVVNQSLKQPLPPASFQRFLRSYKKIPGVVLADHDKEFINKFYNSRFDNLDNVGLYVKSINNVSYLKIHGPLVKRLTNLSEAVANSLYLLASGGIPPKQRIVVPANLTANLLYCLMISANCPSYKEVLGKKSNPLPNVPMSRYVSVLQIDNPITQVIHRLLSYYTGEWLEETQCENKAKTSLPYAFSYFAVTGRGSMVCVRSTTYMTPAVSPAFELQDYHSSEYSTWAESMWNSDIGMQMYLVASPASETGVLFTGIVIFAISFALVYLINRNVEVLFTPTPSM